MAGAGELRILRRRIRSVKSTQKITRAMELIAASRITRARNAVEAARPYAEMITRVVRRSGQVDESRIRCPMTMDIGPNTAYQWLASVEDFVVHAYTCDYDPPSGDPQRQPSPIRFTGNSAYDGSYIDALRSLRTGNLVWLWGSYSGPINFSVNPTPRTELLIDVNPQVTLSGPLGWTQDHLLVAQGDLLINGVATREFFGVPARPVFKHGASECPP
jgi:hypothetical protein